MAPSARSWSIFRGRWYRIPRSTFPSSPTFLFLKSPTHLQSLIPWAPHSEYSNSPSSCVLLYENPTRAAATSIGRPKILYTIWYELTTAVHHRHILGTYCCCSSRRAVSSFSRIVPLSQHQRRGHRREQRKTIPPVLLSAHSGLDLPCLTWPGDIG